MKNFVLACMAISMLSLTAEAGRNQNRERKQQSRIHQGVKSGELTRFEAKKLRQGQHKVDALQFKAKQDGEISAQEKWRIEKAQDHQNKKIYQQKHDNQKRQVSNDALSN